MRTFDLEVMNMLRFVVFGVLWTSLVRIVLIIIVHVR